MKRLLSLALLVTSSFVLTGCFSSSTECKYDDLFKDEVHGARKYVFTFGDDDVDRIESKTNSLNSSVSADSNAYSISANLNSLVSEIYDTQEQYAIINVYSSMFPLNEDILADKLSVYSIYLELFETYNDTLIALTKSQFKYSFFPDWDTADYSWLTDKEELYDAEYYALEQEQAKLGIEYDSLLAQTTLDYNAIYSKMVEIVEVDNKVAVKLGYNNYLDYTYETTFNREYDYTDLSIMRENTKTYTSDAISTMQTYYNELGVTATVGATLMENNSYFDYNENLEDLASYMGGDYEKYFNHFWSDGEYYFGNQSSMQGAFVGKTSSTNFTVAYFGPGSYSSLSTVTHEIGHYMAAQVDYVDGSRDNIDLCEAQAQANELLLAAYMLEENDGDVYEAYAVSQLYNSLMTIIQGVLVADFEYELYTKNNLVAGDVAGIMTSLASEYGLTPSEYYAPAVFNYYSGYYISYGVSIIPAIELFFVAIDDLDAAKADYFTILKGKDQLLGVIDDLGYSSPITTNIVKELCEKIKDFPNR